MSTCLQWPLNQHTHLLTMTLKPTPPTMSTCLQWPCNQQTHLFTMTLKSTYGPTYNDFGLNIVTYLQWPWNQHAHNRLQVKRPNQHDELTTKEKASHIDSNQSPVDYTVTCDLKINKSNQKWSMEKVKSFKSSLKSTCPMTSQCPWNKDAQMALK